MRPQVTNGRAWITILVLVVLLAGIGFGAVWLYQTAHRATSESSGSPSPQPLGLSESTLAALQKLSAPLEIRFYSVLDPASVPESLTAFAGRVDQLLSAYQQAADGKIKLTRFTAQSNLRFNDAPADGIQVFNLDKGEACYLGVALDYKGRKESLPHLSSEWEQALEPDLTRASLRLVEATQPVPAPVAISQVNTAAVREVKALIPDVAAVSVEDGKKLIQAAALKEFAAVAEQMKTQRAEAEQRLGQIQTNGSEADRQAAIKQLQQLQTEQSDKLKQIAAKSQAQIQAFQQLKASSP
jgi:hypothetical protein